MKFRQDNKNGSFTIYHLGKKAEPGCLHCHGLCNSLALCMCLLQIPPLFNLRIYFLEQFQLHSKLQRKTEVSHRTAPQHTAGLVRGRAAHSRWSCTDTRLSPAVLTHLGGHPWRWAPLGLNKCTLTCSRHHSTRRSSTALTILCAPPTHPPSSPEPSAHWSCYSLRGCASARVSQSWGPAEAAFPHRLLPSAVRLLSVSLRLDSSFLFGTAQHSWAN